MSEKYFEDLEETYTVFATLHRAEVYLGPFQASKMDFFAKTVMANSR